jgi:ankyrin repeat protein
LLTICCVDTDGNTVGHLLYFKYDMACLLLVEKMYISHLKRTNMKRNKISLIVFAAVLVAITLTGCKRKSKSPETRPKTIQEAAKNGDKDAVEEFLNQGARVNARDRFGLTSLHWATWHGNTNVVKLLLTKGANIHVKCREGGMTPLHYATAYGQVEIAKLLISNGAEVNAKSKRGGTPLGVARNKEVAELLIANGAVVNTKNFDRHTPLHKAVMSGQPAIVELLLSNGADVNAKDNAGKTPLDRAIILSETQFRKGSVMAKSKKQFEECVEILSAHGAK